jgi:Salmonella virulence plasmid 28.1kDa A protein
MDRDSWAALVREATDGVPPSGLLGDDPAEQLDAYTDAMHRALRAAFPSVAIAADIARGPTLDAPLLSLILKQRNGYDPRTDPPEAANLAGMHDRERALAQLATLRAELTAYPSLPADPQAAAANPVRAGIAAFLRDQDFEFGRTLAADHLAANPDALSMVAEADRPAVTEALRRLERVGRFAPDVAAAHALLGAGLSSAQQIARVLPQQFAATFGAPFGGPQQALAAVCAARAVNAAVTSLFLAIQQQLNGVTPAAIGQPSKVEGAYTAGVPNWQMLFRDSSFCSCQECRSVLGPAAYLVDLLHFLTPPTGPRPVDELLRRRPDIQFLELSCDNTNTVVPYVDLVNEVLETYIAVDGNTATPDALGAATAKDIPPGATAGRRQDAPGDRPGDRRHRGWLPHLLHHRLRPGDRAADRAPGGQRHSEDADLHRPVGAGGRRARLPTDGPGLGPLGVPGRVPPLRARLDRADLQPWVLRLGSGLRRPGRRRRDPGPAPAPRHRHQHQGNANGHCLTPVLGCWAREGMGWAAGRRGGRRRGGCAGGSRRSSR